MIRLRWFSPLAPCLALAAICLASLGAARAEDAPRALDLRFIPAEAALVTVVHPRRMAASKTLDLLPRELAQAVCIDELGFELNELEQFSAVLTSFDERDFNGGMVFKFNAPQKFEAFMAKHREGLTETKLEGYVYWQSEVRGVLGMVKVDDTTFLLGADPALRLMLRKEQANSTLRAALAKADDGPEAAVFVSIEKLKEQLAAAGSEPQLPPGFEFLREAQDLAAATQFSLQTADRFVLTARFIARNEADAEKLMPLLEKARATAFAQMKAQFTETLDIAPDKGDDPVIRATLAYLDRLESLIKESFHMRREGNAVSVTVLDRETLDEVYALSFGLMMPAANATRASARRIVSMNNVKQIMLAMHSYHAAHNQFPQDIRDADGKPLLSWRVRILPFIEQQNLYNQFKLDEPWDSEHNRKLVAHMPEVFRNPNAKRGEPGRSNYVVPIGEGLFGDASREKISIFQVRDGTSNTIAVLQVDDEHAVTWTKPDDWKYDGENPFKGLLLDGQKSFLAGFCDGSVRMFSSERGAKRFHAMLTIAGGEVVPYDE